MVVAVASIVWSFYSIPYYPVWSILVIALDAAVIWALAAHGGGPIPPKPGLSGASPPSQPMGRSLSFRAEGVPGPFCHSALHVGKPDSRKRTSQCNNIPGLFEGGKWVTY